MSFFWSIAVHTSYGQHGLFDMAPIDFVNVSVCTPISWHLRKSFKSVCNTF